MSVPLLLGGHHSRGTMALGVVAPGGMLCWEDIAIVPLRSLDTWYLC